MLRCNHCSEQYAVNRDDLRCPHCGVFCIEQHTPTKGRETMTETEKQIQQKRAERAQALNGELEQSSKFAELRAMHFRAFLNMRLWWQFWKTPTRLFALAHDCARLDYLVRVDEAKDIHERVGEHMRTPQMHDVLLNLPRPEKLALNAIQLAQTVGK